MEIGITGHQRLPEPGRWRWVREQIDSILEEASKPLVGITSLAIGADQLFAESVLQHGGALTVVVPFEGYEATFAEGGPRAEYERLLRSAQTVNVLRKQGSDEESYYEAGKRVVDLCQLLIAVWDGKPAGGWGGTADIVRYAQLVSKRIVHIDPIGYGVVGL